MRGVGTRVLGGALLSILLSASAISDEAELVTRLDDEAGQGAPDRIPKARAAGDPRATTGPTPVTEPEGMNDAKTMWMEAEKLTAGVHGTNYVKPKFEFKDGKDRTFVAQMTNNVRTKEKLKQLKAAEKEWHSAWNLASKPDPPSPPARDVDDPREAAQKKLDEEDYNKMVAAKQIPGHGADAVLSKVIQSKQLKRYTSEAKAAKESLDKERTTERNAAARVRTQALDEMTRAQRAARVAEKAVKASKVKQKHASKIAAKAVESVRQQAKYQKEKFRQMIANQVNEVPPTADEAKKNADDAKKAKKEKAENSAAKKEAEKEGAAEQKRQKAKMAKQQARMNKELKQDNEKAAKKKRADAKETLDMKRTTAKLQAEAAKHSYATHKKEADKAANKAKAKSNP